MKPLLKLLNENKIKIWLDDTREAPDGFLPFNNIEDIIKLINKNRVGYISFDHDLGYEKTGCDLARYIEEKAYNGEIDSIGWDVHSANPVGSKKIKQAMNNADKYWGR